MTVNQRRKWTWHFVVEIVPVLAGEYMQTLLRNLHRQYTNWNTLIRDQFEMLYMFSSLSRMHRYTEPGLSSCSCCQAKRSSNRTVNLDCVNGDVVTHTYIHVEECSCSTTNCHEMGATLTENVERKRSFGLPWAAAVNHWPTLWKTTLKYLWSEINLNCTCFL